MTEAEEVVKFILKKLEKANAMNKAGQEIMLAQIGNEFDDVDTDEIWQDDEIGLEPEEVEN